MNKQENILELKIENISEAEVDYADGDIIILSDMEKSVKTEPMRANMLIIIFCEKGTFQLDMNGKTLQVRENELLFCPPNTLISNRVLSPGIKIAALGLSERVLRKIFYNGKSIMDTFFYVARNPILHVSLTRMRTGSLFHDLLLQKIKEEKRKYHREIMQGLIQVVLYELLSDLSELLPPPRNEIVRQGELLFKRFMQLLEKTGDKKRSVNYYAEQLYVTPKYLTAVCKQQCGKSAIKLIYADSTARISSLLKNTEKTISEIADEMDFPSLSFFGKYAKRCLGMSPSEFRNTVGK